MGLFDVLNFSGDNAAYGKYNSIYGQNREMLLKSILGMDAGYKKAGRLLEGLNPLIAQGYGQARRSLGRAGGAERTSILNNQAQGLGAINTRLGQQGLASTTITPNLERGVLSDTSAALARVDESVGQGLSNLALGQTQAKIGAQGALASLYPQAAQAGFDSRLSLANYLSGSYAQKPSFGGYLGGSLSSGAQLLALMGMGGFGGAGGAAGAGGVAGGSSLLNSGGY